MQTVAIGERRREGLNAAGSPSRLSRDGLARALRSRGLVGAALILGTLAFYAVGLDHRLDEPGSDFGARLDELVPLLDGDSPYPGYAYPPLTAYLFVPFAAASSLAWIWTVILVASVPGALWLLGVRDWRCYPVALAWPPVLQAVSTGNVTLVVLLGSAAAWRWRERLVRVGVAGALTVAVKLVAWPLAVWLASTRRWAAALVTVVGAALVSLALWAPLRFRGLTAYPDTLRDLDATFAPDGYSVEQLLLAFGASSGLAVVCTWVAALAALGGCLVAGRRGDDRLSFALALAAMVLVNPIVWLHSLALLLGIVAVLRPRLSVAWLLPLVLLAVVETGNGHGTDRQLVLTVAVATLAAVAAVVGRPVPRRPSSSETGRGASILG
jgi:hypothetical protein